MPKMYTDGYARSFGKAHYDDLKNEQNRLEDQTEWLSTTNQITFEPLLGPMEAWAAYSQTGNQQEYELMTDTAENAQLTVSFDGRTFCLRDCAMPSVERTTDAGGGVMKADKDDQADILTRLMKKARSESKIIIRAGKASAVLSSRYEYMPISSLLEVCDSLENTFGAAEFLGGEISHSMTVAQYRYPQAAASATAAYAAALATAGRPASTVTPVVEFRSSDTSGESATLLTYLQVAPGHLVPVGDGVKVPHLPPHEYHPDGRRLTCMEKFKQEAEVLFAKLEYDIQTLFPKMLSVQIEHPANAFIGLCKYAQIPQKWGGQIEEEVRMDWPDGSDCTFLDLYEAMTQVTALAIKDGFKPHSARVLNLEEGISKVARNTHSWKKYDVPGTVAWNPNALNR